MRSLEAKLKHLDLVQAVISRLAQNAFLYKGWAITLAAGLVAFGPTDDWGPLLAAALLATAAFWALDAYYLWLERCFRRLYDEVRRRPESDVDFSLDISSYKSSPARTWLRTCRCWHLICFYVSVGVIESLIIVWRQGDC